MAQNIILRAPNGSTIYYPRTVSNEVYDNEENITVKEQITKIYGEAVHFMNMNDVSLIGYYFYNEEGTTKQADKGYENTWFISKKFPVGSYYGLTLHFDYNKIVYNVACYDDNMRFIQCEQVATNGVLQVTFPHNARYFELCWGQANTSTDIWGQYFTYITQELSLTNLDDKIDNTKDKLYGINKHVMVSTDVGITGQYITTDGSLKSADKGYEKTWFISNYLRCEDYQNIEIFYEYNQIVSNIAFYDIDYKFISARQVGEDGFMRIPTYSYPSNAVYFRLCWGQAKQDTDIWGQYFTYYKSNLTLSNTNERIDEIDNIVFEGTLDTNVYRGIITNYHTFLDTDGDENYDKRYEWYTTTFIPVNECSILSAKVEYNNLVYNICWYDSYKRFIRGQRPEETGYITELVPVVPANAKYFRLCWGLSKVNTKVWEQNFRLQGTVTTKVSTNSYGNALLGAKLYEDVESVKNIHYKNNLSYNLPSEFKQHVYLDEKGKEVEVEKYEWYATDFIKYSDTELLGAKVYYNELAYNICWYDADKFFISGQKPNNSSNIQIIEAQKPTGAVYYKLCWGNAITGIVVNSQGFRFDKETVTTVQDAINKTVDSVTELSNKIDRIDVSGINNINYCDIFDKYIFIGDSLTHGDVREPTINSGFAGNAYLPFSYPTQFSKIISSKISVYNAAQWGITALQWWQQGWNKWSDAGFDSADCIVIELGWNGSLAGNINTDVIGKGSYNNYADTQVGGYCKIIEKLKEMNPYVTIILVISSNAVQQVRNNVNAIAKHYTLPVIDINDFKYFELPPDNTDNCHFTIQGYYKKAWYMYYAISDVISENIVAIRQRLYKKMLTKL